MRPPRGAAEAAGRAKPRQTTARTTSVVKATAHRDGPGDREGSTRDMDTTFLQTREVVSTSRSWVAPRLRRVLPSDRFLEERDRLAEPTTARRTARKRTRPRRGPPRPGRNLRKSIGRSIGITAAAIDLPIGTLTAALDRTDATPTRLAGAALRRGRRFAMRRHQHLRLQRPIGRAIERGRAVAGGAGKDHVAPGIGAASARGGATGASPRPAIATAALSQGRRGAEADHGTGESEQSDAEGTATGNQGFGRESILRHGTVLRLGTSRPLVSVFEHVSRRRLRRFKDHITFLDRIGAPPSGEPVDPKPRRGLGSGAISPHGDASS